MAISGIDSNTNSQVSGVNNTVDTGITYNPTDFVLGFDTRNAGFLNIKEGSELVNSLASGLETTYKNNKQESAIKISPKVDVLDNAVYSNMVYSTVIVSNKVANKIYYYTMVLEATGRKAFTAKEVVEEINAVRRNPTKPNQRVDVYVPGDANDVTLHATIRELLSNRYGTDDKTIFVSLDGHVVFKENTDGQRIDETSELVRRCAVLAYNALYGEALQDSGAKDLNITIAKTPQQDAAGRIKPSIKKMRFIADTSSPTTNDEIEAPVRSNWKVLLEAQYDMDKSYSLNTRGINVNLVKTMGFVDAIPFEEVTQNQFGQMQVKKKFKPHVVITDLSVQAPMTGYALLGIISGMVMTNPNMWMASLDMKHAGALNLFADLNNEVGSGKAVCGSKMDFVKAGFEKSYSLLNEIFAANDAVVSVDIQAFGPQTFYTSLFGTAAAPVYGDNAVDKQAAAEHIVNAAHWLTNGLFPKNFDPNKIFVSAGVPVPLGTWQDKTGLRDIRDVDYAFIASQTDDLSVLQNWSLTTLPASENGGFDPFLTRVEIINKFLPSAKIHGKAIRVTFTSEFISTLVQAAKAAGLDASYEAEIQLATNTDNFRVFNNFFAGASVNNAYQFANQYSVQGPNILTPYSNFGYGRY